jgi:mono/diheme cytochrome c family protein
MLLTPTSSPLKPLRNLAALAAVIVLSCSAARAQENLDAGKSPQKLFAEGCSACHRSAKGLAKGRFSFTLYLFLQKHYASNASSAWALTSYLEAVDAEKRGVKRAAVAAKPPPAPASRSSSTWSAGSSLRPPASVPNR